MSNEQVWWGQLDNDSKIHTLAITSEFVKEYLFYALKYYFIYFTNLTIHPTIVIKLRPNIDPTIVIKPRPNIDLVYELGHWVN